MSLGALPAFIWLALAPSSGVGAEHLRVQIVAIGDAGEVDELKEVAVELLARLPITVDWTVGASLSASDVFAAATESDLLARVWVDLSDPAQGTIYIANSRSDRFVMRGVHLSAHHPEAARESLAHIMESAVDAMLAGAEIGVTREVAEREITSRLAASPARDQPPLSSPPPPPSKAPAPLVAVPSTKSGTARKYEAGGGAFYRVEAMGTSGAIAQGPGLDALVLRNNDGRRWALGARLAAQYVVPYDWNGPQAGARFWGGAGRIELGATLRARPGLGIRAALGAGIDLLHVGPRAPATAGVVVSDPFWVAAPVAGLSVSAEVALAAVLALIVSVGTDTDLAGNHFDVVRMDQTRTTSLSAFPLRPWLSLGVRLLAGP